MKAALLGLRRNARPIQIVGINNPGSFTTTHNVSQPSGTREGDFGVIVVRSSFSIPTPPAGWTAINGIYHRQYDGTEGTVSFTQSGAGNISAVLVVVRGVRFSGAYDTSTKGSDVYSGANIASGNPTATADDVALAFLSTQSASSTVTVNQGYVLGQAISGDRMTAAALIKRIRSGQAATTTFNIPTGTAAGSATTVLLKAG